MFDFLFGSKNKARTADEQIAVELKTSKLSLYHIGICPFCIIVQRQIKKLDINIELKSILKDKQAHKDLVEGGGKATVPCLIIEGNEGMTWLYESADIVAYLTDEFGDH